MIHAGDCIEVMATFEPSSIDAIVTDPPYGLEFMGKDWDRIMPARGRHKGTERKALIGHGDTAEHPAAASPTFGAQARNARCLNCGGWRWSGERTRCQCDRPEFRHESMGGEQQGWHYRWATEAFRIAKPGAHLLAFGGTRTYHRLAAALEDAGWEIRDTLVWAYASGFPKSLDVSKALDKLHGVDTGDSARWRPEAHPITGAHKTASGKSRQVRQATPGFRHVYDPSTEDAVEWRGWGTALKPAWEPIVMARKPLIGSVARNVLAHGTGALNIDGTRIPMSEDDAARIAEMGGYGRADYIGLPGVALEGSVDGTLNRQDADAAPHPAGRWPANVVLTDPVFDGGIEGVVGGGAAGGGYGARGTADAAYQSATMGVSGGYGMRPTGETVGYGDEGTYSRFFLIPKAGRDGREPVIRGQLATKTAHMTLQSQPAGAPPVTRENDHPTVKPVDLMRHLVRLVTPPGGTVLDPFLGSGTTALAAEMEGFGWIGIEREPAYVAIAEARLNGTQKGLGLVG